MKAFDTSRLSAGTVVAAVVASLSLIACAAADSSLDDGSWVGTITTDGSVTTVVNESGSVWGGAARLVEELSIGVEAGADEYMFGEIISLYADADSIFVVDRQAPAVRVYDHEGRHRRDYGSAGQGPGEYTRPSTVGTTSDGSVLVLDDRAHRINAYASEGEPRPGVYPLGTGLFCCPVPWRIDPSGTVWVAHIDWDPRGSVYGARYTLRAYGPDGPTGAVREVPDLEFDRATVVGEDGRPHPLPYSPHFAWSVAPDGALIVGASDRYRFEIHHADGSTTRVEKWWDKVPISAEEADYHRRFQVAVNRAPPGWDGAELPEHMPAFMDFVSAPSGEVWVRRPGPTRRSPDCADVSGVTLEELMSRGACWQRTSTYEVFGSDGRFLGAVDVSAELRELNQLATPWIDGDRLIMAVTDEAGTIMVKRYRLVLPGEV